MKNKLPKSPRQDPAPPRILTPDEYRQLFDVANSTDVVLEIDMEAHGSRTEWGTWTRPGRLAARKRFILTTVRAAEIALSNYPQLELWHVLSAIRAHCLSPSDLLISNLTGEWTSTKKAVAHRGREYAQSLAQIALTLWQVHQDSCKVDEEKGKGAA
jgi:hypothetical protein